MDTGFNDMLMFNINSGSISKGSYIQIGIPNTFQIYNLQVAAGTCLNLKGFSDEIACTLTASSKQYMLQVTNGFNSKAFAGGVLSFNMSEVRNPKNTMETDTFTLSVFETNG